MTVAPETTTAIKPAKRRAIKCVVVSDKMDKSRVARVDRLVKHSGIDRYVRRTSKVMFHDEKNETRIGDEVTIESTRPYSARKRFRLVSILKKMIHGE